MQLSNFCVGLEVSLSQSIKCRIGGQETKFEKLTQWHQSYPTPSPRRSSHDLDKVPEDPTRSSSSHQVFLSADICFPEI